MNRPFDEKLADIPIVNICSLLSLGKENFLFLAEAAKTLKISETKAIAVLENLERKGLIQKMDRLDAWCNSISGDLLADAILYRTLSREAAKLKISHCLERVRAVNDNPFYLYKIVEVYVVGEYLQYNLDTIRFVDLIILLSPREKNTSKHEELEPTRIVASNKRFSNYTEQLFYPEQEVRHAIKAKVHNLRIQCFRENINLKEIEKELIFQEAT